MGNDGLLLIDKPAGWTSVRAVYRVKKLFPGAKAGHAGTLDPAATGLLIVGVGEATKVLHYLLGQSKRYRACVRLGVKTATGDADGKVIETADFAPPPGEARLQALFRRFTGEIEQTPPMVSALKVGGVRLYELARRGETVECRPRTVTIHSLELVSLARDGFCFDAHCSKGAYMRVLAEDLGAALGTVAHLASLRRTASGAFSVEDAADPRTLDARRLLPPDAGLMQLPAARLDAACSQRLRNGGEVAVSGLPAGELFRVYDEDGALLAVADREGGQLRPRRVFRLK